MKEEKFESEIWDIWLKVHNDIPPIRKETYKLLAAWKRMKLEEKSENENADLSQYYHDDTVPEEEDSKKLFDFAKTTSKCARAFQEETQKLRGERPSEVLRITTRAGVLLYYIEQILLRYKGLKEAQEKAGHNSNSLPMNFGVEILSQAMTAAATARDQIIAADGYVKNLKERIGTQERKRLLSLMLLPIIILYLGFHLSTFLIPPIPVIFRVFWEVVFWSLFGAISISFITISEDVNRDVFDPRHLYKYEYRIAVSPFIAAVLVFFVSLFGIVSGSTTIKLDLDNPNFPVVILLSFLFGFFGKRSLELLDNAWQRLFPFTRGEKKQETPITTQNSSNELETSDTLQQ